MFPRDRLKNYKYHNKRKSLKLKCIYCIASTVQCDARLPCAKCKKAYVLDYWSPRARRANTKHGTSVRDNMLPCLGGVLT